MKKFVTVCHWHQNTRKWNKDNFSEKMSYQQAKELQKQWVLEEIDRADWNVDLREKSIDTGDCTIGVVRAKKAKDLQKGKIEYYDAIR